jgi:hypothetical protein
VRPAAPPASVTTRGSANFSFNATGAGALNRLFGQPFFFRFNPDPLEFEAAREQSILFNRASGLNQPVSRLATIGPLSATPRWPLGVNPFMPLYPGGPTALQQAYTNSLIGGSLNSFPPGLFNNPFLTGAYPPYYGGYPGYGGGGYSIGPALSSGGYISGGASALGSESPGGATNSLTSYVTPDLANEAFRQARLNTRRRAFDEYLYERLNAPTNEDLREFGQHEALRRSLSDPPRTEVWSGQSLNTLLADVQKLQGMDRDNVPEIPLDEDVLKRINVTATGGRGGNMGFLKDGGRISWPLGLRALPPAQETRELRSQVNSLLQDAVSQAANGKVDAGLLQELSNDVDRLNRLLQARANDMPENTYIDARQFLKNLDDAVRLLQRPEAGDYVSGRYAAKGNTVQKLVQYMTNHGLQFGPAVPGDEGAYQAVQQALARYDTSLRAGELRRYSDRNYSTRAPAEAPSGDVVSGTVVRVLDDQVIVRTADGKEVTLATNAQTTVTADGRRGRLADLKAGTPVRVSFDVRNGRNMARSVTATPRANR